jgi:hypothetical protein
LIETFLDQNYGDAHVAFQRWRAHNWGDGHFLNYRSTNDVMLHRSPCPHLGDTDWAAGDHGWRSLTRKRKDCSTDRRELERRAKENATTALKRCRDCERL